MVEDMVEAWSDLVQLQRATPPSEKRWTALQRVPGHSGSSFAAISQTNQVRPPLSTHLHHSLSSSQGDTLAHHSLAHFLFASFPSSCIAGMGEQNRKYCRHCKQPLPLAARGEQMNGWKTAAGT